MGTPEVEAALADLETGRVVYDGHAEVSDEPRPEEALTEAFEQSMRAMVTQKSSYNGDYATAVLGAFDQFVADLAVLPGFDEERAHSYAELVWQRLNVFKNTAELVVAVADDDQNLVRRSL